MPRSAFGSLPVISHVMVVGADSESCSKVTVPLMLESPRTVATEDGKPHVSQDHVEEYNDQKMDFANAGKVVSVAIRVDNCPFESGIVLIMPLATPPLVKSTKRRVDMGIEDRGRYARHTCFDHIGGYVLFDLEDGFDEELKA